MPRHPVPVRLASLARSPQDRSLIKRLAAVQSDGLVARAEDATRREVVAGRISDTAILTHHAIDEGIGIAVRIEVEVAARPLAAAVAVRLGDTGVQQIDRHLRSYGDR